MKVSELIKELRKAKEEHGDMSIKLIVSTCGNRAVNDDECFWGINIEEPILFTGKTFVISVAP